MDICCYTYVLIEDNFSNLKHGLEELGIIHDLE